MKANTFYLAASTIGVIGLSSLLSAGPFTAGNLAVYRVGATGGGALSSASFPVFVDEYTTAGVLVQSIPMGTTTLGSRLTSNGTASAEGYLTLSSDGKFVVLTGYDAPTATAGIATSAAATYQRTVGRVDHLGNVAYSPLGTSAFSGAAPRSVASTDGSSMWVSGGNGGVQYHSFGSPSTTQVSSIITNLRVTSIFNSQLYYSTGSTTPGIHAVGSGLPTTGGQPITAQTTSSSPYGFFMADLSPSEAGMDALYIADDTNDLLKKFSKVSGAWVATGSVALTDTRGLTGSVSGGSVTLYSVAGVNTLRALTDTSGYNTTMTGSWTTLATAGTNNQFRGVAFAPVPLPGAAGLGAIGIATAWLGRRRRQATAHA